MKNLKRFLIIGLFSFIFLIGNVYAAISSHYSSFYYDDTYYNDVIKANQTRLDNLHIYLTNLNEICNNGCFNLSQNKYVLFITGMSGDTWTIDVGEMQYIQNGYQVNGNQYFNALWLYYGVKRIRITFSGDNVSGITNNVLYGNEAKRVFYGDLNPINNDVELFINNFYVDTYFISDNINTDFKNDSFGYTQIPIKINDTIYSPITTIPVKEFFDSMIPTPTEPTYTMSQEILENGNVKLTFNFTNYDTNNGYGFTITNKVSGEEYGIENPFTSIYPNIIPFGNTYEIIIPYETVITISLSKYTLIEGTELYDREPIYVDSYDINNIVFDNVQTPYFSIISQTQDNLIGRYNNTKNGDICGHIYSNNNVEWTTNCNEVVDIDFSLNGYVEMYVKRNNNIIYSRKINYISQNQNQPYITWNIEKQDFYSIVNWNIKNYDNQMTYRFSKDNGATYTNWNNAVENNYINVYDNNTIIIEIANNDQSIIYDTKAINVVNDISSLNNKNNTTNNIINKFNDIFNVNGNILQEIENYWRLLKNSKIYLIIFIPFITSIICAIIYLIRRA